MNSEEIAHVENNLVELIKNTICNVQLLSILIQHKILSQTDYEEVKSQKTPLAESKRLYEILQTRTGAFQVLVTALENSKQSGAIRLLKKAQFKDLGLISVDLNQLLGQGRSKVYRGKFDGREVAVKVIREELDLAMREVEFLKKLDDHENIVRYYIAEQKKNKVYVALELCLCNLEDELKLRLIKLEPIQVLKRCTRGLAFLHKNGIIHMDVKPTNILLNRHKQVKISDFGLSRQLMVGMSAVSVSELRGTYDWMAPEILTVIARNAGSAVKSKTSSKVDIFSLGCLFYFVLSNGQHLFGDHFKREQNIMDSSPQWGNVPLDDNLKELIKKMTSRLPNQRPSAEDVLNFDYFCQIHASELSQPNQRDKSTERIDRLSPLDTKHNFNQLDHDLQLVEVNVASLLTDTDSHVSTSPPMEKEYLLMSKTVLETRLLGTNSHFRFLHEVVDWIVEEQTQLLDADYGEDLPSVQAKLENQQKKHHSIEKFQSSVDKCFLAKSFFNGDELKIYINYLNGAQKLYAELLMASKKRTGDLETLMDLVQSATNELVWLSEKEEREITRDWSSNSLNLVEVEQYYEHCLVVEDRQALMSELVKREIQFNAVQDKGKSLLLQQHPASKCIETYISELQTQWASHLQLTICLETHLKHVATYKQYFNDIKECEQTISRKMEMLNTVFIQSDFSLDEGELLLKEIDELRVDLTKCSEIIQSLSNQSREIIPLKQRKMSINQPITVTAICNYKQNNQQIIINKDERCTLRDNSQRVRWRITNSFGLEVMVPSVCFLIPPPDKDSLNAAERLRRTYDRVVNLYKKRQIGMRRNMIFVTIKAVKSWSFDTVLTLGSERRIPIREALNKDVENLIHEGDATDPGLGRLRRELKEVNMLFDEFEKRAIEVEKTKNTVAKTGNS